MRPHKMLSTVEPQPDKGITACTSMRPEPHNESSGSADEPVKLEKTGAWEKYSQIENVQNADFLQRVEAFALAHGTDVDWIATEKVHGANFSFETDGERVDYASRSQKLGNGADFHNARSTMPPYHPFVKKAFNIAKEMYTGLDCLTVFGEYFGGYYPGEDVVPGLKKIQGGVAYSPGHHFYAYDVSINRHTYLAFDECYKLLSNAGFPLVAAPLKRGSLRDVLSIDVEALETSIPAQLGHPPAARFRTAEGVVIRPSRELPYIGGQRRVILKKKAAAFWENTNQHTQAAKVANHSTSSSSGGDAVGALIEVARDLINENRLRAVISKDPDLLHTMQQPKLCGLFTKDVLEDMEKSHAEDMKQLGKDIKIMRKAVQFAAGAYASVHIERIRADIG